MTPPTTPVVTTSATVGPRPIHWPMRRSMTSSSSGTATKMKINLLSKARLLSWARRPAAVPNISCGDVAMDTREYPRPVLQCIFIPTTRGSRVSLQPARPSPPRPPKPGQPATMQQTYFRKGFGLKATVRPIIDSEYHSAIVERIRSRAYTDRFGDITVRLAKHFGFCYGVDRAVDYAYETRHKFPDKRIYLVGEIIHNPHVNTRLDEMGIESILPGDDAVFDFGHITADDVVIIPAFGVTLSDLKRLQDIGCILVDTTCGSVLLVWKRRQQLRQGWIHGRHPRQVHARGVAGHGQPGAALRGRQVHHRARYGRSRGGGRLHDRARGTPRAATSFLRRFAVRSSDGFDPDRDLARIGVANQTTMLATESLAIGARLREMMAAAHRRRTRRRRTSAPSARSAPPPRSARTRSSR